MKINLTKQIYVHCVGKKSLLFAEHSEPPSSLHRIILRAATPTLFTLQIFELFECSGWFDSVLCVRLLFSNGESSVGVSSVWEVLQSSLIWDPTSRGG